LTAAIAGPVSVQYLFDPDDPELVNPPDMPAAICHVLGERSLTTAEVLHAITCSLALKAAAVLDRLEQVTGRRFPGLHVVGGGARNEPLCRAIATAIGRPVWAGPAEATTIGNALMQMQAQGVISGRDDARNLVLASFPPKTFEPERGTGWDDARSRFETLTNG
jgi:rhamnulokinase